MKVVVQSSSLIFTLLSIVLNVPIARVKRRPDGREESGRDRGSATGKPAVERANLLPRK
jgi:hypothetical protein